MKIIAILTGKDKSSFRNKNKIKILNRYIFNYSVIEAKKVSKIEKFYTSSDSRLILNETKKNGFESIKRPKNLSTKNSKHVEVIKHALKTINKNNIFPEIIVILLANAPIIKAKWINDCINLIAGNRKITAVVPVKHYNDHHPERAKKIKGGILDNFIKGKKISSNRQDLTDCYFLCHNFWVIKTKEIFKNNGLMPWSFMGKKVKPYVIKNSIDIHDNLDVEIAKILIKNDKYIR